MNKYINKFPLEQNIFLGMAVPIADILCPIEYSPNGKYDNKYFLVCLLDFCQNNVSWKSYNGCNGFPISGKYLNSIHLKYSRCGVYDAIHKALLGKYLKTGKEIKLKHQLVDTSYVANKQGIHNLRDKPSKKQKVDDEKNETNKIEHKYVKSPIKYETNVNDQKIQFNRYNGRKKYFKLSAITDSKGVALGLTTVGANKSDAETIKETIEKIPVDLKTLQNSTHNRYKQSLLADSGYCSNKNRELVTKMGYIPLISYNKRNTKDQAKIKKNSFTAKQKQIYKKRLRVESFFSWIKRFPVINQNYQKTITSYTGLLMMAASLMICKKV